MNGAHQRGKGLAQSPNRRKASYPAKGKIWSSNLIKRPTDPLNRDKIIEELTIYLEDEMELAPTKLGVEGLLDHVLETVGKPSYQRGVEDSQKALAEKFEELNDKLFVLQTN